MDAFWLTVIGVVIAAATITWTVYWQTKPKRDEKRERERASQDAILGKPAVTDLGGTEIEPAMPGLVHVTRENSAKVAKVEETLVTLVQAVAEQKAIRDDITELKSGRAIHEHRLDDHDVTLGLLVGDKFERGANAALSAVEKARAGAIDVEPDE